MADVKRAVQVIGLMQKSAGQEVLTRHLEPFPFYVLRPDCNSLAARDRLPESRNAEASFFARLSAFHFQNLRVDQNNLRVRVFAIRDIDDRNPSGKTYLRRRKPHSSRG